MARPVPAGVGVGVDVTAELAPSVAILLVEDEPANRALVRAMAARPDVLPGRRIELHEAPTIAEARAAIDRLDVALVLLDVRLPDGSGLDLAAELRDRGGSRRPVVVVTSASVLPGERSTAFDRGADAFLGKPFGFGEFVETLRRHLDGG